MFTSIFTHKKVIEIKRGNPIPSRGIYIRSEWLVTHYEDSGCWAHSDTPVYAAFDIYEVPCTKDGKTE